MNHRNNRRSEATKNKIKQALVDMLREQTLDKITVQALCQTAQVNRSTFYNHYHSPESVLNNLGREFIAGLTQCLEEQNDTDTEVPRTILLLTNLLEYIQKDENIRFLLLTSHLDPDFRRNIYQSILEMGLLKHPAFQSCPEEILSYKKAFILYGTGNLINLWLMGGCQESPQEIGNLIIELVNNL